MADEVGSRRGLITGTAGPGVGAGKALETFRAPLPSQGHHRASSDRRLVERSLVSCLRDDLLPPGELKKFWPAIIERMEESISPEPTATT